jgi:hypothetical protein
MLNDCRYDKIKVMHELSCLEWFLAKHACQDAKKANHDECAKLFESLQRDIKNYLEKLDQLLCK